MITVQVTGVYTGALSLQATVNGTNWITVGGTPFMGIAGGTSTATIASATQSIFQAQVAGYNQARITALAAVTGTATVTLRQSIGQAPATVALPAGAAVIGALTANQTVNVAQLGGTAPVTAGVAGTQAVGGNIAVGTAATSNPVLVGGVDANSLTRRAQLTTDGFLFGAGPGETISQFSVGTGAAAVTDGTNGKTIFVPPIESDVYLNVDSISTTPTIQLEGSYDNMLFAVIPLTKVDATAASLQYASAAAFTPVAGGLYKGKTYGFPILRVHLTAGTTTNTVGVVRVIPVIQPASVATVSPFALTAASTTEAVGVANGQVFTGGVRTLNVQASGSTKAIMIVDAVTGTLTYTLEGSTDGTNYNALNFQPLGGGPTVATVSATGTAALPQSGVWEADVSSFTSVRVHCTAFTSGVAYGALKLVSVPTATGVGNSKKASYVLNMSAQTPTSAGYVLGVVEASATKKVFIKKLTIWQAGSMTAAQVTNYSLIRETTASSVGTTQVPAAKATTDTFGGLARIAGATAGTAGTTVYQFSLFTPTAVAAFTPQVIDFTDGGTMKGIEIQPGTANGVYLSAVNGAAGAANVSMNIEFTEE
jgi:hypothetical protein